MEKDTERNAANVSSRRPASPRPPEGPAAEDSNESQGPDRIRILAYEIYETRSSSGMLGDAVSDWLEAERRLAEAKTPEPATSPRKRSRRP